MHHLKPITMEKTRKQCVTEPLEEKEIARLRWPANQCLPMLGASVSLLQASMAGPRVSDMLEANRTLRFAKECVDRYELRFHNHGELNGLTFAAYSDAAWAVRPDGASQGGHVIFAASQSEIQSGKPFRLTVIDWASKRLTRVCRSSLAAETQAAATAVDELEWVKTFWHLMIFPESDPLVQQHEAGSFVITDAKSLYDAANSMSAGLKLAERRSAIELAGTNERLRAMRGHWKWCNSDQQLADGLTKTSARAASLESFARGVVCLKYDEAMVAAKKVPQRVKDAENAELDKAANDLHYQDSLVVNSQVISTVRCALPGCEKCVVDPAKGHRFCSRRHFYKSLGEDGGKVRAVIAATVLACQAQPADARPSAMSTWSGASSWELSMPITIVVDLWQLILVAFTLIAAFVVYAISTSMTSTSPTTRVTSTTSTSMATPTTRSTATSTSSPTTTTRTMATSTHDYHDDGGRDLVIENIQMQKIIDNLHDESDGMRVEIQRLEERLHQRCQQVQRMETQVTQAQAQLRAAQRQAQHRVPDRIYLTPYGQRFHLGPQCGHIRGHQQRVLTPCGDCARG